MAKKKRRIVLIVIFILIAVFIVWTAIGNKALQLNSYTVSNEKIPEQFDGFKIAQVSDLHNTEMGKGNKKLLDLLDESNPDIIVITGDLIDSRRTNVDIATEFIKGAVLIAPCYYVTGNHEARVTEYLELKKNMEELGVTILENECVQLERSKSEIALIGVNDPSFQTEYLFGDAEYVMTETLKELVAADDSKDSNVSTDSDDYTVLLSHRPELFDVYVSQNMNLVFSGHAHGGQYRLPIIGGLIAPNQGLFPEYDSGLYAKDDTTMIVSRGIGNSILPFRVNNPPEVIITELMSK